MVDTVSTDVLVSGQNIYNIRLIGESDGTGEAAVAKIDISTLVGPNGVLAPSSVKIMEIQYDIQGFSSIKLSWDGGTDTVAALLSGQGIKEYSLTGGLVSDATGGTNDLKLTSSGAVAGATYDILLICKLKD